MNGYKFIGKWCTFLNELSDIQLDFLLICMKYDITEEDFKTLYNTTFRKARVTSWDKPTLIQ